MSTSVENDLKELKSEYASLKSDIGEMSKTLSKLGRDGLAQGRDRVYSATEQSRERAKETWGKFEHEIEERPITSLAVALGVGFVLGKLLSR